MGMDGLRSLGIKEQFLDKAALLVGAAGAFNSLRAHKSALNKVRDIEEKFDLELPFPWSTSSLVHFIMGCAEDQLKASSVRCYISQVKKSHLTNNLPWTPDTVLPNALLRGMANTDEGGKKRIAITPRMILSMKRRLLKLGLEDNWSRHDRRCIWLLITFLWAGSFRVSELLAPSQSSYLTEDTFTWGKLQEHSGNIGGKWTRWATVKLQRPKEMRAGRDGVNIEMFQVDAPWCPITALDHFRKVYKLDMDSGLPVFRLDSGLNVTPRFLNKFIRDTGIDLSGYPVNSSVTTHSFRAGIVSLMGSMGEPEDLIKSVGRWSSNAWVAYAKTGRSVRKSDQLRIQNLAASEYESWEPVPILVEVMEEENLQRD